MLTRVAQFIKEYGMLPAGCRVLAGVSGGMDSMAMLHILHALRESMGFSLSVAHFNHGIRAESGEEEAFVWETCRNLGVELHTGRADVPGLARARGVSLEVAAREARHGFFRSIMAEHGFGRLALAHHMGDQAETVLLRLIRGAGAAGLSAMAPAEGSGIVRPLLCLTRGEIREYCRIYGVEWREDASNADTAIPRNKVRHEVLPRIEELNPSAVRAICRAAELLRADEECLSSLAAEALEGAKSLPGGGVHAPAGALSALRPAVQSRAIRLLLARAGLETDVGRANVGDIAGLLKPGMTGRRVDAGAGFTAVRDADALAVLPELPEAAAFAAVPLNIPGETRACGGTFRCEALAAVPADYKGHPPGVQYADADRLPGGLVARGRLPGDRFHVLNAPGGRKLKEVLIDRKLPRRLRDSLPLLAAGREVLWAAGLGIADSVKITGETRRALKITYTAGEGEPWEK